LRSDCNRSGTGAATLPGASGPDAGGSLQVLAPGAILGGGRLAGVAPLVPQAGEGQRAQDRLGVLPADHLQSAPGVGGVDGLVADVAESRGRRGERSGP
jgi:hypothetical protein